MSVNEIYRLLKKYRENRSSDEERERILRWYHDFDVDVNKLPSIPSGKLDQLWIFVENQVGAKKRVAGYRKRFVYYSAAVIAILFIVAGGFFYLGHKISPTPMVAQGEIFPAKNTVTLQLSDGRVVDLNKVDKIKEGADFLIKKNSSKELDYTAIQEEEVQGEVLKNTINVPVGGEYNVVLADGSRVFLNSCSSLTYPITFTGEKREVELRGEAYFEVQKGEKPFIVKTDVWNVRVLGTKFNVSAYLQDELVQTTLLKGSIAMQSEKMELDYMIEPGEMFAYNRKEKKIELKQVDTDLAIAWMSGNFKFRDMRLEDIMNKLNRWYGCEVIFADKSIKDLRFTGMAEKDRPISYLLDLIGSVTNVHFEIVDKKIVLKY